MKPRVVVPEILDELPADDPEAIRSRRDLRLVNSVMGNYRWLARQMIAASCGTRDFRWLEIGAGEGRLATQFPAGVIEKLHVTAIDFAPRPRCWPAHWNWLQGDLFAELEDTNFDGVVGSLFLHHFENDALARLGKQLSGAKVLAFSEPARRELHHWQGRLTHLMVNRVTRHDLHVSIDAGFRGQELAEALNLSSSDWKLDFTETFFGAYRMTAHAR